MPPNAISCTCVGFLYPDATGRSLYFFDNQNKKSCEFPDIDFDEYDEIGQALEKIVQAEHLKFVDQWNHYRITLDKNHELDAKFVYIPDEDHDFPTFMKAISDLTEEE
ncbi:hypothetical protein ACFBZI_04620 [Moraxella sp. ZJ142]|uniref:hypothetical protein n=1 Tax=Moraxella marmotae TaxID=3344520 RepID=UPI0035D47F8D